MSDHPDKLEEFPEGFGMQECLSIIETKQQEMTLKVRREFYESIMFAVNSCQPFVKLTFPKNHRPVYKKLITEELLDRFGPIETETYNRRSNSTATVPITNVSGLSSNIDSIIIRFLNESD